MGIGSYSPEGRFVVIEGERHRIYVDPEIPFWFVPSPAGDQVLKLRGEGKSVDRIAREVADRSGRSFAACIDDVEALLKSVELPRPPAYTGRAALELERLNELWFHVTDECNARCGHCLFADHLGSTKSLSAEHAARTVRQALPLGLRLVCFTGGEPLVHPGFIDMISSVVRNDELRIAVLTNGTFIPDVIDSLKDLPTDRLHFQVSIDGPESVNDRVRGRGAFADAVEGLKLLAAAHIPAALSMTVHAENVSHMVDAVDLAHELGVGTVHYLWHFRRGSGRRIERVPTQTLFEHFLAAAQRATSLGVAIDNLEALAAQVFSHPGAKFDLGNSGWQSLAVGPDGSVYPSPALVHLDAFRAGHLHEGIEKVWRDSPTLERLRRTSLIQAPAMASDPWRFIIGGGDLDHCYVNGDSTAGGPLRDDPYRSFYGHAARMLIEAEADGLPCPDRPGLILRMGEVTTECPSDRDVNFTHCNCILSLGGGQRRLIRDFYAEKAKTPDEIIFNPVLYPEERIYFVPVEARSRMYGCGSPVLDATLEPGQTVVDLGSGTGVEVFIAASLVGAGGSAFGVDMTDAMLEIARRCEPEVHRQLGYANTAFHKGYLEDLPFEDATVDAVISNCVINLSRNKRRVYSEIFRVLKPGGRLVISDVAPETEPPLSIRGDHRLIGQCVGGTLVQEHLLSLLRDIGFVDAIVIKRFPYRVVDGHQFYSLTFRAYRPAPAEQVDLLYTGPCRSVVTDTGVLLRKGERTTVRLTTGLDYDALAQAGIFVIYPVTGAILNVQGQSTCCSCNSESNS